MTQSASTANAVIVRQDERAEGGAAEYDLHVLTAAPRRQRWFVRVKAVFFCACGLSRQMPQASQSMYAAPRTPSMGFTVV